MTGIERLNNTGESLLEQITSYLNEDIPVIIENVTESWPNRGLIDVENLKQVWLYHIYLVLKQHFLLFKIKILILACSALKFIAINITYV